MRPGMHSKGMEIDMLSFFLFPHIQSVGLSPDLLSLLLHSPSFKLAVEDCLDATFRVFLEDVYSSLYASPPPASGANSDNLQGGESSGENNPAENQEETAGLDTSATQVNYHSIVENGKERNEIYSA